MIVGWPSRDGIRASIAAGRAAAEPGAGGSAPAPKCDMMPFQMSARRGGALRLFAILLVYAVLLATGHLAQPAAAANEPLVKNAEAEPVKVRELLGLLADPQVQAWLEKQRYDHAAAAPAPDIASSSLSHYFGTRIAAIRQHIADLSRTVPDLPAQFARACDLFRADLQDRGAPRVLSLLAVFVALGFGVEWLFRAATEKIRRHLDAHPVETVSDRMHLVAGRFGADRRPGYRLRTGQCRRLPRARLAALLGEIVFGYLVAILAIRIAIVVSRFLLAPYAERFRAVPMDTAAAYFWHRRIVTFVGLVLFRLRDGRNAAHPRLLAGGSSARCLCTRPRPSRNCAGSGLAPAATAQDRDEAPSPVARRFGRGAQNALLTVGIVLLWVLWVASAMPSFWLLAVIIICRWPAGVIRRAVEHLLRPPGSPEVADGAPSVVDGHPRARAARDADHRRGCGARLGLGDRPRALSPGRTRCSPGLPMAC